MTSKSIPRIAFRIDLGRQTKQGATACAHHFLVEVMWFEKRRDTPRHHVTFLWIDDDVSVERRTMMVSTVTSLALESMRGDAELREERRGKRLGGAPACGTYDEHLTRLMMEAPVPLSRGIHQAVQAHCTKREQLEMFTMRVAVWQLRCLYHRAGTDVPQLQSTFGAVE